MCKGLGSISSAGKEKEEVASGDTEEKVKPRGSNNVEKGITGDLTAVKNRQLGGGPGPRAATKGHI